MLRNGWIVDEEDGCTSFYDPDGVGALQLSQYAVGANVTGGSVMREFLASVGAEGVSLHNELKNGVDFTTCSYVDDDDYFRIWVVAINKLATLITYTCAVERTGSELDTASEIVSSLMFK